MVRRASKKGPETSDSTPSKKKLQLEEKAIESFVETAITYNSEELGNKVSKCVQLLEENPSWVPHLYNMMVKGAFQKLVERLAKQGVEEDEEDELDPGPKVRLVGKHAKRVLENMKHEDKALVCAKA